MLMPDQHKAKKTTNSKITGFLVDVIEAISIQDRWRSHLEELE